jgi:hypothetical protein
MAEINKGMIDPMESYDKAQNVQREGRETKLERLEVAQARR